jgi:predicted lipid-binding transport protein (Tim44 family)
MKHLSKILLVAIAGLGLLMAQPDDAFAKRLGGGKSFGSRPSYSQPYKPSPDMGAAPRGAPAGMASPTQRNQPLRDSFRSRGGLMGMLGGLALGGLIGAMLFGGAFENINFLDIAILGFVAYLLFRMFASRRTSPQWETGREGAAAPGPFTPDAAREPHRARPTSARFDTDVMSRGDASQGGTGSSTASVPAGFDHAAFMSGAKQAYRHLQKAWDDRDLTELRALTTDRVFEELRGQLQASTETDKTDIIGLEAQLLGVERSAGELRASVLFDARVREAPGEPASTAREVWHFTRSDASPQPTWFLDGIQQMDE